MARSRPESAAPLTAAAIEAAAAPLDLGLRADQCEQLAAYAALLLRWNAAYNLTAIDAPEHVLTHHLLDSLAVVPLLRRLAPHDAARVLDVGSGGGLPGIPLAIAQPTWRLTLIDAVGKKVAFMTQAALELGLGNVQALHRRVETVRTHDCDVVVSRAFAALGAFARQSRGALAPAGVWVAMRGAVALDDAPLPGEVTVSEVVRLAVPQLAATRHAVVLRPVAQRGAATPAP